MGDLSEHFSRHEFECRCGCGKDDVFPGLIDALEKLRSIYGKSIIVLSGVRCMEHNRRVGGKPNSAHLRGKAADILVTNSPDRFRLLNAAFRVFNRVGIYKGFIHVDVDESLPQDVCWVGI